MQNPLQKFRQSSIVFEEPGTLCKKIFLLENWKLWRALTALQFNIFCWSVAHVSYLPMSTKWCARFISFCLDPELFAKIKNTWFLHTFFIFLLISQDLNKIKKNPEHHFLGIIK